MDPYSFPPISALLDLAYTGLMALSALLTPLAGAGAAALAVVLVTLAVRSILVPAGIAQAKAERARSRLAPRLQDLQKRHRKDPELLRRETMKLYRDEGASPFAGCLPMLIQAPIVGVLYSVFLRATVAGHPNELLSESLLGVPLGTSLAGAIASGAVDVAAWAVIGAIVLAIAAVGEMTRRLFRVAPLPASDSPLPQIAPGMLGMLQFVTAIIAVFVPLAAALYLLVTVTWTLAQRLILRRAYPPG